MADAALAALRAATCACTGTARRFSPEQSAEAAALVEQLRVLFSRSATAATAELPVERRSPLLPQLPTELTVEVLQHLDVRSLGRLACTCRQLYFDLPCPPRPTSLVEAAIRRRADEIGRWMPSSLPAGVSEWVPFLLQREWRSGMQVPTVATGRERSFFVDANGALLACGKEEAGEVGLLGMREGASQTSFTAVVPTPVPSPAGVRIRAEVCHDDCNLAMSEAGQVFEWGRNVQPSLEEEISWSKLQPPVPPVIEELRNYRVGQVLVGLSHSAVVTEDGDIFTWQTNRYIHTEPYAPVPELGYGRFVHDSGVPHRVLALEDVRIASVAIGNEFTAAVTVAGAVFSFGLGDGRLGHWRGFGENVFLPKRIEALDGIHVVTVAAKSSHTLALTRCGQVYSWGTWDDNSDLMVLGLGSDSNDGGDGGDKDEDHCSIPHLITALLGERVRAIAAGPYMSCAVTDAGALYTWGCNDNGNLGHGDKSDRDRPTLVQRLHGIRVVEVSLHTMHTLALAYDGSVYAFGRGPGLGIRQGAGDGEEVDGATPRRIPELVCMVPWG
jgi:alpha-tubulin suppressor-like RCC1 family protein